MHPADGGIPENLLDARDNCGRIIADRELRVENAAALIVQVHRPQGQ